MLNIGTPSDWLKELQTNAHTLLIVNFRQTSQARIYEYKEQPDVLRQRRRVWGKNNPDKIKEYVHNRRAIKHGLQGRFTQRQFKALCRHFGNRCIACGGDKPLTADHVIPQSWGNRPEYSDVALNDIDNIQPMCLPCNASKNAKCIDYRTRPHINCIARHFCVPPQQRL